jgi:UDP-4-amino-4,6-dideoxy-N-acetyl-beta-L-altrosamine N-acetyltransferase
MKHSLRELEKKDLKTVLEWRNAQRIRQNMFNDRVISFEEHKEWYHKASQDPTVCNLIFSVDNIATGFIGFSQIDQKNGTCFWGFYIGNENAPKGIGYPMGYLGIEYAMNQLKMRKINGEVLSYNIPSIKFHERLGFEREGLFNKHYWKNGNYQDVIRYALFNKKWALVKGEVKEKINKHGFNFFQ